ncbi:uncharacterized protein LOC130753311 [Actinidia eriantha]|uniref:uncharacterized protein LOC130753311 n=1 Tax=Actinidia eriantha TaxID=165200 RepID=UPI00258AEB9E|nr:uncharacterized protein LOC130753311 [Actinidia eriantha]
MTRTKKGKRGREKKAREEDQQKVRGGGEENDDEEVEDQPVGDVLRASGRGRGRQSHYEAYEYDGIRFDLEDLVLGYIVSDLMLQQLLKLTPLCYCPEEAKKRGGNWQSRDTRELFYSFHLDSVPAETVKHKCVVHFIPLNNQIPNRKQHPGFGADWEGLPAEVIASKKPEESMSIQTTEALCKRCMEKKVGVTGIIKAGLEEWYQKMLPNMDKCQ